MSISIIPDLKGPDEVPRSVVELTPIRETESHRHLKAQLLYVITAEADGGTWTVRPHCAIWIPRGVSRIAGIVWPITVGNPCFEPTLAAHFVTNAVSCSSSRRFAYSWPLLYPQGDTREERFVSVLLDELQAAPLESRPSQPSFSYRYELLGAALRTG